VKNMPLPNLEEAEAVERAKNGDVEAYETLYHLHKHRVYSLCLRITGNMADAEDLTQDTFVQLYRKLSTFRNEARLATWLHRVGMNFALMHLRKCRLRDVSLDAMQEATSRSIAAGLQTRNCAVTFSVDRLAIGRAASSLPEGKRTAFLLHDVKGFSHGEVARQLGVAVGSSKSQVHRARLALRTILGHGRPARIRKKASIVE
jgi:RNA polymerase sigma-70 factor (ECF subfamily)